MKYQELFPVPVEWLREVDLSLASTVGAWAEAEVMAGRLEHREDFDALLMPAMRKLLIDIGLQSVLWPEEMGGGGLDSADAAVTLAAVCEQVGRADTGIAFLLANAYALQSAFALEPARNLEVLESAAPVICGSEVALSALVLPAYGTAGGSRGRDFFGLQYQASADADGDGWSLAASRARPQCAGALAAFFGVAAEAAEGGPGLFMVPSGTPGVTAVEPFKKTGLAASVNADIELDAVKIPSFGLVAEGDDAVRGVISWYYTLCSAVCCGALLASYDILKEWVDTRVIKGKGQVFKENPVVASLLGEIGSRTGTARVLSYNAARMISMPGTYGPAGSGALAATATAVFKTVARDAMESIDNTMELMGSAGYATEWNLERYWRDVKTLESYVVPETVALTDMARHYYGLMEL